MRAEDGGQLAAAVGPELDYLSGISRRLGVRDLVAEYFAPVLGEWGELQDEAERWRAAGVVVERVTRDLTGPLGKLDSAWQGRDADSFVDHMRQVGLAGHDMSDAMHAMGEALDQTAEGVRGIVRDMARVYAEAADAVSGAAALPLDGDRRVVEVLDELHDPARELHEAARDVLEAFARLCEGVSGSEEFGDVEVEHRYPERNWAFDAPRGPSVDRPGEPAPGRPGAEGPADPKPAAAGGGGAGGGGGGVPGGGGGGVPGGGVPGGGGLGGGGLGGGAPEQVQQGGSTTVAGPSAEPAPRPAAAAVAAGPAGAAAPAGMGMMGGMMAPPVAGAGGQQGGDQDHKSKVRIAGSTEELFGKPGKSAPPVLGDD
ncbi:WXG100 family type VII secretion target [Saccharothrix xinjiangensis]|uniref:WXG100 family type VII secretion target n=1 Tax=Saccharothrix xinjiangensis TaxID=204798 RepID=A0ABV9Y8B8_9PSEU